MSLRTDTGTNYSKLTVGKIWSSAQIVLKVMIMVLSSNYFAKGLTAKVVALHAFNNCNAFHFVKSTNSSLDCEAGLGISFNIHWIMKS